MKRLLSTVVLGSCLAAAFASNALAFDNTRAGIALHVTAPVTKNLCDLPGIQAATINYEESALSPANFFFTYLLVCNGSDSTGIAGAECGIQYPSSIQVFNWFRCADQDFPTNVLFPPAWPNSGGGNLITWDADNNCQNDATEGTRYTVITVAGFFYMGAYAPSQMSVINRHTSGFAKVADCSAREDDLTGLFPSHLGVAGFGGAGGYNPCGAPTPIENTTWGAVKSLYNR